MCLSMRMRRFSGLQMRMNEWVREGADYYSFCVSHVSVGRYPMYCLLDLFLSLLFIILVQKLHVLVHSLFFSAFFAIELLCDKGKKGCTLTCCKFYTSFTIPCRIGGFCDNLRQDVSTRKQPRYIK
jgi:hypothetical protein